MNENTKEISIKITDRHTSTVRSHHSLSNGLQSRFPDVRCECNYLIGTLLRLFLNGMRLNSRPEAPSNGRQFVYVMLNAGTRGGEARKNPLWPHFVAGHLGRPRPQQLLDGQSSTSCGRATARQRASLAGVKPPNSRKSFEVACHSAIPHVKADHVLY